MKKGLITSVITLMFAQAGVTDNTDLMRCNILAMHIENQTINGTLDINEIKESSAYLGCHYDVPFDDNFLQSLLDKANNLFENYEYSLMS